MGDRGNIYVKQNGGKDAGIYLYGHWSGYQIPVLLRDALKRGEERWGDEQYLTRVIFDGLRGDDDGLTGFGISTYPCDNERKLLVVDAESQTVSVAEFPWTDGGQVAALTFKQYIALSDKKAREFRDGPEEE